MAELTSIEMKIMVAQFLMENGLTDDKMEMSICKELLNDTFNFANYEVEEETGIPEEDYYNDEKEEVYEETNIIYEDDAEETGDVFSSRIN